MPGKAWVSATKLPLVAPVGFSHAPRYAPVAGTGGADPGALLAEVGGEVEGTEMRGLAEVDVVVLAELPRTAGGHKGSGDDEGSARRSLASPATAGVAASFSWYRRPRRTG